MTFSDEDLNDIYDKNDGYCWHCGKKMAFRNYGIVGAKGAREWTTQIRPAWTICGTGCPRASRATAASRT